MRESLKALDMAGCKRPNVKMEDLKDFWLSVFAEVPCDDLIAATRAHIMDPDQGRWWPKPADIMRHVHASRARQQRVRAAIEADAEPAKLLGYTDTRRTERDARRAEVAKLRSVREDRERREKAKEQQDIADGRIFGVEIRRLARHTASALHELGSCERPRGEHQRWHAEQSMAMCPYRETIERRERSPLRVVGGTDLIGEVIGKIGDGAG